MRSWLAHMTCIQLTMFTSLRILHHQAGNVLLLSHYKSLQFQTTRTAVCISLALSAFCYCCNQNANHFICSIRILRLLPSFLLYLCTPRACYDDIKNIGFEFQQ